MNLRSRFLPATASLTLTIAIAGCEKPAIESTKAPTDQTTAAGGASGAVALPASLFLAAAPDAAQDIKAAKASVQRGDKVVIRGRIGGSAEPFVENRAVFTLMDKALPACSDNPDDACESPWDYCCESRDDIVAHAATIQIVDTSGMPLKTNMKNAHGLKPLTEVIVVGTVSQRDDAGTFVINASGLYIAAN